MDLFKLLASAFKRLSTAITSPFRMMIVQVQRLFNINIITAKLIAPLTKKIKELLGLRPKSKEDYVTIGRWWVFRKLFMTVILVACAGVFLYFTMYAPKLPAQMPKPEAIKTDVTFDYDDMDIRKFSGVANIRAADGKVVYTGDVDKGVCTGEGTLFSRDGKLLYKGGFEQNMYSGAGVQYYPDGKIHYEGEFAQNKYNGAGKLYDEKKHLLFEGTFKDGLYDGEGKLYSADGMLDYEGGFSRGQFHGVGVSYNPNGSMDYQGEFYMGKPQGSGTLYSSTGMAIYTGSMFNGEINYKSLINATLADVETVFSETPKIYYTDRDSCFVFEQAGVIVTTDCRVKVDVWEKPVTEEEKNSEFFYMPGEYGTDPVSYTAPRISNEASFLGAQTSAEAMPLAVVVPGTPDGNGGGSKPKPRPTPKPEEPEKEELDPEVEMKPDPETGVVVPQIIVPGEGEVLPDFVEKNLTLYFEIDKNVWQSEAELDKTKVFVKKITVMQPGENFELPDVEPYDDNLAPGIEDCVAIDKARQTQPTVFSNILFEMDRQNKLFVRLKNISYAERIVQKSYLTDGLIYRCSYQLDDRSRLMYYSIEQ